MQVSRHVYQTRTSGLLAVGLALVRARAAFRPVPRTAPAGRRAAVYQASRRTAHRPPAPRHPLPPQHQVRTFHASRRPAARTLQPGLHADATRIARRPPMLTPRNPARAQDSLTRGPDPAVR